MKPNEFTLMKDIKCSKCNQNIDVVAGYFSCEICFEDLCKACASTAQKEDEELVEPFMLSPVPLGEEPEKQSYIVESFNSQDYQDPKS